MKKHEGKPTQPSAGTPARKTVEINITLPSFATLQKLQTLPLYHHARRGLRLAKRRPLLVGGVACALLVAGYGVMSYTNARPSTATQTADPLHGLQRGTPDYRTLLPKDKTTESLGGWVRVSPADRNPVYAYVDQIGTTSISVSQQPLPDTFKDDTHKQVEELAKSYSASEKIEVGGTPVYIGTSTKGPQSVIFTKDKLLILIKSTTHIENDQWQSYIASLR